jgi:hypothetical protein
MASSRSFRLAAVTAFIFVTLASSARASDNVCSETNGIRVQDARLLIVPNFGANSSKVTLSGHALISDPNEVSDSAAHALCVAALGRKFQVNKAELCRSFSYLSSQDTVKPYGNAVEFALSKSLAQKDGHISIDLPAGESICAYGLIVEVRAGPEGRLGFIDSIPKSLTEDRAEFEVTPGARSQNLNIQLFVDRNAAVPNERTMHAPRSWGEPIAGFRLQPFTRALLLCLVVALFLTFFEKAHPLRATFGSVSTYLKSPITAAMAFFTAGPLMECVGDAANLILRTKLDTETFFGSISEGIKEAAGAPGLSSLNIPVELSLCIVVFVPVSIVYYLLVRPFCERGPVSRVIAFPLQVTVHASAIAVVGLFFALLALLTERNLQWFGFEAAALVLSFFYAWIGVHALRHLFELPRSRVIAIALLVSLTVFFPTDPVFRSSAAVASIGDNTRIWARFLCYPAADFIYIAALTGFAFRIAGSDELHDRLVAQWLMFLLILQVASFSMGNPTNTVAIAGVVLLSSRWLLAPEDRSGTLVSRSSGSIDWETEEETFPFIVGGAAAFIFLIQFIFEAGGSDQSRRFVLLGLAKVPRTFAMGAVAALVLARAGPYLRGDSATLKAVNVSVLILLANMAGSLAGLQGRERLIAVLASNLGVIASLILCSVVVYDLQRAKAGDGHLEWRDLFKGTTLARSVSIVSAVAVALFSALSPIFIREIGDAFGTLLKIALPQLPAGN